LTVCAEIEWRRQDEPAIEPGSLSSGGDMPILAGVVDGTTNSRDYQLRYTVRYTADWNTRDAVVEGNIGDSRVAIVIARDATTGQATRRPLSCRARS